jgi:protein-S-isoprenylcysteine O-methyltransferase Ste14
MRTDKKLRQSKKAIVLGVALLNLNAIFIFSALKAVELGLATQMITAILFLVGIYTGVQGGIDMIQSNKLEAVRQDRNDTIVTKNYEYRMEYADKK